MFTVHKRLSGFALLTLLTIGCSVAPEMDYSKAGLVGVSGTVTLDGAPLPNAVVAFESEDGRRLSYGQTDVDGQYTLQFDSQMDGVIPGKKIVRISTTRKITGLNTTDGGGEAPPGDTGGVEGAEREPEQLELVPEKYNKESELTVEVKPDEDQTFDFELKSEPEGE